jgi:hypothetical protein
MLCQVPENKLFVGMLSRKAGENPRALLALVRFEDLHDQERRWF